ncbi:MAG TPA: lactonase family protein [Bryobacteraceae bacterium]|nr:lactonase family protein [Bryobacteraceae bacterium]
MRTFNLSKLAVSLLAAFGAVAWTPGALAGASKHLTQTKYILYIGAYGKGISAYRFDASTGKLEAIGLAGELGNPSFLASDSKYRTLYAVSEVDGSVHGAVGAFAINRQSGALRKLNTRDSGGIAPCHLATYQDKALIVANYTSGGVSSYPIEQDGSLGEMVSLMTPKGHGPNPKRQEGPHAHEVVIASSGLAYVPDLGLDQLRIYNVADDAKLTVHDPAFVQQDPGMGPRHMAFTSDQKYAFVVNELKSVVSLFRRDTATGAMTKVQDVSSLPEGFSGENDPAEILVDAGDKYVYSTNRGNDSVAVFSFDAAAGKLQQIQVISTEGKMPRGLEFDPTGHFLFAGNQKTNNFVVFRVDQASGKLTPTGQSVTTPSPVAFLFVPVE